MLRADILVFGRERFCPDVTRTRERLSELGFAWTEYDIESDHEAAEKVETMTGKRGVPTVIIRDAIIIEPSNDELDATLRATGYDV